MKKIISIFLFSVLCFGAHARGEMIPPAPMTVSDFDRDMFESAPLPVKTKRVPPKPWSRGWQVGAGIPLVTPLTGYNGFIGYANKKSEFWLGRRVGARFDFQVPSAIRIRGELECVDSTCDEYNVNASGKLLFANRNLNGLMTIRGDEISDDPVLNLNGVNGIFSFKNQNIGGIVDIYPFGNTWFLGGIRLSGGYYAGLMEAHLSANIPNNLPNDDGFAYDVSSSGGTIYARMMGKSSVAANFRWKYSGPYLGAGFDLGIFKGFKFYLDAGVIFTDAPRLRDEDFVVPTDRAQVCYKATAGSTCEWVQLDIDRGAADLMGRALGSVISGIIADSASEYGISAGDLAAAGLPAGYDTNQIGQDLATWLSNPNASIVWIDNLIAANAGADMVAALNEIRTSGAATNDISDIQNEIDKAIADYHNARRDAINDANDAMKDFRFVPMIKLGVMYRF